MKWEDNIVIVLDNGNYKESYAEQCPFKAKVLYDWDNELEVISLSTGKEYLLYYHQVLECMDMNDIEKLINMDEYGS